MADEDSEHSVTIGIGADRTGRRRGRTRTRSRSFRRLEERSTTTAPAPVAWLAGIVVGGLAGAVFYAWETLVVHAAGVALPAGAARTTAAAASLLVGAVIGAWSAATGLYGPRWSSTAALGLLGWLAAAKLGRVAGDAGIPAAVGGLFAVFAGIAAGQLVGRLPGPAWAHQGFAATSLIGAALLAPLHLWVLPGGSTTSAALTSVVALLVAIAMAGAAAGLTFEGRAPLLPLGLALAVALGLHGVVALRGRPRLAPTAEHRPVVVVAISGLRADKLGATGDRRAKTPRLDAFARTALVYERAYATSNWSAPSLGSLLTGRWPYAHGLGASNGKRNTLSPLRPDVATLAQRLRDGGTVSVGAVAWPSLRTFGVDAGFAAWEDDPGDGALPALLAPLSVAGADPTGWARRATADLVTDRAVARVGSLPDAGWLLFVQYGDAGGPFTPTPEDEAAVGYTTRPWPTDVYDASLRRVDRAFGQLLDALPKDAWVFVVGDRGTNLGESRPDLPAPGHTCGNAMYDELVHVPLLVRAPGVAPARLSDLVSIADIAPTVLAIAGIEAPSGAMDGEPLSAVLGRPAPRGREDEPRYVLAQSTLFGVEQQMVIEGWSKLVAIGGERRPLFDLRADPHEGTPLRPAEPANDAKIRHLEAVLPPMGAAATMAEPPGPAVLLGAVAARLATGGAR